MTPLKWMTSLAKVLLTVSLLELTIFFLFEKNKRPLSQDFVHKSFLRPPAYLLFSCAFTFSILIITNLTLAFALSPENSFKSCVLSWFFLWHLIWLSVMQLRNYLFIGTLNPMLNRLANQDPDTGK